MKEVDYLKLKNAILEGLAAWTEAWKADDWQYAPGKITKWLMDEKYLEEPRKKRRRRTRGWDAGNAERTSFNKQEGKIK